MRLYKSSSAFGRSLSERSPWKKSPSPAKLWVPRVSKRWSDCHATFGQLHLILEDSKYHVDPRQCAGYRTLLERNPWTPSATISLAQRFSLMLFPLRVTFKTFSTRTINCYSRPLHLITIYEETEPMNNKRNANTLNLTWRDVIAIIFGLETCPILDQVNLNNVSDL